MVLKVPKSPASMEDLEASGMKEFDTLSARGEDTRTLFHEQLLGKLELTFENHIYQAFSVCIAEASKRYTEISKDANPNKAIEVFHDIFNGFLRDLIRISEHLQHVDGAPEAKGLFSEAGIYLQVHDKMLARNSKVMELLLETFVRMKKETPRPHSVQSPQNITIDLYEHPYPQALYPGDSNPINYPLSDINDVNESGNPTSIASIFFFARYPYSDENDGRREENSFSQIFSQQAEIYFRQIINHFETHVMRTGINRASTTVVEHPKNK